MNPSWITEYTQTASHALTAEWFVSPLEYSWPGGKRVADAAFAGVSEPSEGFDRQLAPHLYREAMVFDFRAKMMVLAYMREPVAKSYGLEIEGGLCSLYGLDFRSSIAQWIYIIEGYCKKLFDINDRQKLRASSWTIPTAGHDLGDQMIAVIAHALGEYLDGVVFKPTTAASSQGTRLSRHLMLHGNLENRAFYSQKNALCLMFVLDALVTIEMLANRHFPAMMELDDGDERRISRRKQVYADAMHHALDDVNVLKLALMDEHA